VRKNVKEFHVNGYDSCANNGRALLTNHKWLFWQIINGSFDKSWMALLICQKHPALWLKGCYGLSKEPFMICQKSHLLAICCYGHLLLWFVIKGSYDLSKEPFMICQKSHLLAICCYGHLLLWFVIKGSYDLSKEPFMICQKSHLLAICCYGHLLLWFVKSALTNPATQYNTLQHTATHCRALLTSWEPFMALLTNPRALSTNYNALLTNYYAFIIMLFWQFTGLFWQWMGSFDKL